MPLLEGRLQRDMVVALDARWPGIERQASMNGATLKGGARAWSRHHSEGALQGDPDLNVREGGRNGERGIFVEVKLEGRALSPLQRWRFARLKARNYACVVAHSVEDLLTTVLNYLPPDFTAVPDPVNDPRSLPRRTRTRTRAPRPSTPRARRAAGKGRGSSSLGRLAPKAVYSSGSKRKANRDDDAGDSESTGEADCLVQPGKCGCSSSLARLAPKAVHSNGSKFWALAPKAVHSDSTGDAVRLVQTALYNDAGRLVCRPRGRHGARERHLVAARGYLATRAARDDADSSGCDIALAVDDDDTTDDCSSDCSRSPDGYHYESTCATCGSWDGKCSYCGRQAESDCDCVAPGAPASPIAGGECDCVATGAPPPPQGSLGVGGGRVLSGWDLAIAKAEDGAAWRLDEARWEGEFGDWPDGASNPAGFSPVRHEDVARRDDEARWEGEFGDWPDGASNPAASSPLRDDDVAEAYVSE